MARVKDQIDRKNQDKLIRRPGLLVAGFDDRLEEIAPGTYILGHVFSGGGRAGVMPVSVAQTDAGFDARCRTILSRCWGSYVAIRHAPEENGALSVLTEPMGMRDCVAWEHEGITAIAGDRSAFGPSHCSAALEVIHPLLSQPLVEYALGQSIMVLTDGRRDRALARAAFGDRLPAAIIVRPGKGALSGYFGRILAMSVETLRIELLEGALAKAGVVDRAALEQVLDTDYLMREDCYSELLTMLEIERWMQAWQARLGQGPA